MHLIQILLPLYDNGGAALPRALFDRVREELAGRFGGLTAFTRSPAEGLWSEGPDEGAERDEIVVFEVMVEELDRGWWHEYRRRLEARFHQDEIVVRAHEAERI